MANVMESVLSSTIWTSCDIGIKNFAVCRMRLYQQDGVSKGDILNWELINLKKSNTQTNSENIGELVEWWKENKSWFMNCDRILIEGQAASVSKIKSMFSALLALVLSERDEGQRVTVCDARKRYRILFSIFPPSQFCSVQNFNPTNYHHRTKYCTEITDLFLREQEFGDQKKAFFLYKKKDDLAVSFLQIIVQENIDAHSSEEKKKPRKFQ